MIERSGAKCDRKLSSTSFLVPSAIVRTGEMQARGALGQTIRGVRFIFQTTGFRSILEGAHARCIVPPT